MELYSTSAGRTATLARRLLLLFYSSTSYIVVVVLSRASGPEGRLGATTRYQEVFVVVCGGGLLAREGDQGAVDSALEAKPMSVYFYLNV
jgi:hypothetical protein